MATSAFKSTTKRTPIGASSASVDDSASSTRSSAHRRSRSLSRFSHRTAAQAQNDDFDEAPAPRGRFVNTVRGSGFPEISLDDLAVEFFGSGDRGRSASLNSEVSPASGGSSAASQRRGRSVSRQGSKANGGGGGGDGKGSVSSNSGGGGRLTSDNGGNSRRRRSVSVVRYQISDSEVTISLLLLFLFSFFTCFLFQFERAKCNCVRAFVISHGKLENRSCMMNILVKIIAFFTIKLGTFLHWKDMW